MAWPSRWIGRTPGAAAQPKMSWDPVAAPGDLARDRGAPAKIRWLGGVSAPRSRVWQTLP
jgi:hypothetical protein